jgi:hypothetical protein
MPTIISDHPLDKIFGDIPARLPAFPHASVRHYTKRILTETSNDEIIFMVNKTSIINTKGESVSVSYF